jgi:uncharacterized protein with GYD domain
VPCPLEGAMGTYIILSRFSPRVFDDPQQFRAVARAVSARIKSDCPNVTWKESYVTLGRFDVVDLVEAVEHGKPETSQGEHRSFTNPR